MAAGIQLPGSDEMIRLQQQVAQLQALLEASRQVHSTVHEEEVLKQVLQIVVRELEMNGASFPAAKLCYGEVPAPCEMVAEAASEKRALSYPLDDRDGRRMEELLVWSPEGRALSLFEDDFIQRLTQQAAVALENLRNHQQKLAFALLEQDLDASRQIQRSRLPHALPAIDGYSLGYRSIACYHVGGDYLDIVEPPDGSLVMVVADVAGKGLASAIMSTSFRSGFRALAFSGIALDELASRINHFHWAEGEEAQRRFVTAVFLRLQPKEGVLEVVNAGHNPGFLVQPGVAPYLFEASGVPLGLFPDVEYTKERREFKPGARLLVYTDGLTEFFKGEQEFGPERLLEAFTNCRAENADTILDAMWKAIADFSEGGQQRDDMTALALYCELAAEKPE
jgi:serine phosphatase RsbU (regulator of sigma subunit)